MAPLVYFVRHGQTDWNAENRLQGQADTDINSLGRTQADGNGARLAGLVAAPENFDFVASPMRRTRETMERIRVAMGLERGGYRIDPRLVEIHFGDWQGFTYRDLELRQPGVAERRARDKWRFVPPGAGAESYASLVDRIRPAVAEFTRPTVCVTHGGVLRLLFHILTGMPGERAVELEIPQDRILRWKDGALDWL